MRNIVLGLMSVAMVVCVSGCLQTGSVAAKGEAVVSDAISKVDYDADSSDLTLVFERGTYEYADVPQKVYDDLMASESKGSFFQANIKDKFKATKVE